MNPRFFADTRDLFKYDLVEHLVEGIPGLCHFLFVPMLTEGEGKESRYHDLSKARAGYLNRDLLAFLELCNGRKERDVSSIAGYFRRKKIGSSIVNTPFTRSERDGYFRALAANIPPASLVLLDPDNGLEAGHPGEKHLLFSELSSVLAALGRDSLAMVFQFYPRVNHGMYRAAREAEITRKTGLKPLWVTDNQVIFFLVVPSPRTRSRAALLLGEYASRYPAIEAGGW